MHIQHPPHQPPTLPDDWHQRWEGPDQGTTAAWVRGLEMATEQPELAASARKGELPILPWSGGVEEALKSGKKDGSILYLAMWLGLRGEALNLHVGQAQERTCSRTGMVVRYQWWGAQ